MLRACPEHSGYSPSRPPKSDCTACWAAYGRRRAIDDGLRSTGKAKGARGRASKAKGRTAVLAVACQLREAFNLDEGDVFVKATSQLGCDLHLSPLTEQHFPFSIEVKNQEALNIWAALRQAEENATPERPAILFFKRANTAMYVALRVDHFLRELQWRKNLLPLPVTPSPTPDSTPSNS